MITAEEHAHFMQQNGVAKVMNTQQADLTTGKTAQYIHFAVCGVSGAGKSSFLNSIRRLDNIREDTAEVDDEEST